MRFLVFSVIGLIYFSHLDSAFSAIKGPKGYREVYCGKKVCQWKNETTDETVVFKRLPKNLATQKGTISFSKKYLTNTRIGAKNLGYKILGSEIVKTTKKSSSRVVYFKSRFKKDGQDIWLNEKMILSKNPVLIQHYSPTGLKAQATLDQVN